MFYLRPLFQESDLGVKQGLGVYYLRSPAFILNKYDARLQKILRWWAEETNKYYVTYLDILLVNYFEFTENREYKKNTLSAIWMINIC